MTDQSTAVVKAHVVQVASGWPASDAGWQTMPYMVCHECSEGLGQVQGHATITQDLGTQTLPNRHLVDVIGPSPNTNLLAGSNIIDMSGRYVRVLIEADAGTIRVGLYDYKPLWHGIIGSPSWHPDGSEAAGGMITWDCAGIAAIFDQIYMFRGWEYNPGDASITDPGYLPPFNDIPDGDARQGSGSYVPELLATIVPHMRGGVTASRSPWYASSILDYLVAGFANPVIPGIGRTSALNWTVSDPDSKLFYVTERLDFHGKTLAEALNMLANPARGCSWKVSITGTSGTIHIVDISSDAAGGNLDTTGDLWKRLSAAQHDDYYDMIVVTGKRPLVDITLVYDPASSAASTITPISGGRPVEGASTEYGMRKFKLSANWVGAQYATPGIGLRNTTPWSAVGTDGARTFGGSVPPPGGLIIERRRAYPGSGSTPAAEAPRVFVGSGTSWIDLTDRIEVTPGPEGSGEIVLGSNVEAGQYLFDLLDYTGRMLLITIGIREWKPLLVAWRRTSGQPRDTPRILTLREEDCDQQVVLDGTVLSVGSGAVTGALTKQSGTYTVRNDLAKLQAILERLKERYSGSGGTVAWEDHGTIDTASTYATGAVVRAVSDGLASMEVNAVVNRRTWMLDFESFGTRYSAERLKVSDRAFA